MLHTKSIKLYRLITWRILKETLIPDMWYVVIYFLSSKQTKIEYISNFSAELRRPTKRVICPSKNVLSETMSLSVLIKNI